MLKKRVHRPKSQGESQFLFPDIAHPSTAEIPGIPAVRCVSLSQADGARECHAPSSSPMFVVHEEMAQDIDVPQWGVHAPTRSHEQCVCAEMAYVGTRMREISLH